MPASGDFRPLATLALAALLAACQARPPLVVTAWEDRPAVTAPGGTTALVLYTQGGWAREVRPVDLMAGKQIVRFPGIAPRAQESGLLLELPAKVGRRTFQHDLRTREALLQQYHGRTVFVEEASGTREGTLLWTPQGIMVRVGDRLLLDPPRLSLPPLPGLATDPTFTWEVEAPEAWSGQATATYPVDGLGWLSEHTLITDADQTSGTWRHEAAVTNQSGLGYMEVQVTLVTGAVRREAPPVPLFAGMRAYDASEAMPRAFAGRYTYPLTRTLTLAREQTVRVTLDGPTPVRLARVFRFDEGVSLFPFQDATPRHAHLRLGLHNRAPEGPGIPLPAGRVLVYTPESRGALAPAGEARIADTPVDQELVLDLGEAFDLTLVRTQTRHAVSANTTELGYRLVLRNRMQQATEVEVLERLGGDWSLLRSSHPATRPDTQTLRFAPTLPASGEVILSYEVKVVKERP